MAGLFQELKRRNVARVGVAYIIVGWVVVQIAQVLFEVFGTPDWVIKTVIVLIAIGFPFALLFAWAFELTPDGLKKTRDVDATQSITPKTGQRLNYIIIAALVIALGYSLWERQPTGEGGSESPQVAAADSNVIAEDTGEAVIAETAQRSIAVLPFINMSSDQEQEWFADGLTEEILNSLAKTPDLLVAARTSSFGYKGSKEPATRIAAELGVNHILEGSVRRGGDKLRITAQLIRAKDGFHLWSETYDRSSSDVIAIQEEIAVQIANALETTMDPEALAAMMDVGTSSVPAYEAYLRGRGVFFAVGESGDRYQILEEREAYERAVEIDPAFATAWYRLYVFWTLQNQSSQVFSGVTGLPKVEIQTRMRDALAKAIEFEKDPTTSLKYQGYRAWEDLRFRRSKRFFTDYLRERPNDEDAFGALLFVTLDLGLHRDATALIRDRYENFEFTRQFAAAAVQALRTPDDAEFMRVVAREAIEKYDDIATLMYQAHRQLLWAGDIDGAAALMPKVLASDLDAENRYLVELRQACAEKRIADAKRLHQRGLEKYDNLVITWLGDEIMGDKTAANALFAQLDAQKDFGEIANYLQYPQFDPRQFPNFMQAVAGQGFEEREVHELPYRCNR